MIVLQSLTSYQYPSGRLGPSETSDLSSRHREFTDMFQLSKNMATKNCYSIAPYFKNIHHFRGTTVHHKPLFINVITT